jgi:hypothetical protein
MELWKKIITLYPELEHDINVIVHKIIRIQNDGDEKGDYIATWNHPTIPRVTDEQLSLIEEKTE